MKAKILMIDDDEKLCQLVKKGLDTEGYQIEIAHDGVSGLEKVTSQEIDLILLDVMMPHLNGFKTLNYIREISQVPVIMLTARGEEIDELLGLSIGADDYIDKPCSLSILRARINSILKRTLLSHEKKKIIYIGNIEINLDAKKVFKNGEKINLTKSQFQILCYLADHKNKICSKEDICKVALKKPFIKSQRSIDTQINKLREILFSKDNSNTFSIENIYGVGYELKCK